MWIIHTFVYCIGVVLLVLAGVFCLGCGLYTAAGEERTEGGPEDHLKVLLYRLESLKPLPVMAETEERAYAHKSAEDSSTELMLLLLCCPAHCLTTPHTTTEWLEDHVKTTQRLIKRGLIFCASVQLLWLVLDRHLVWPNLIGLASHANSWWMLKYHYPNHMGLEQPPTIVALALLVIHQTSWVLSWGHEAGGLLSVAAVLATVVWPIPIMLLLSAGTESDLPTRMPVSMGSEGAAVKGSIPGSPAQPGSPFVDAGRLRMRHSGLQPRGSMDSRVPADTAHQSDQGALYLLGSRHSRQGSGGSNDGSFSSSMSAAWGLAERLQQQQGFKKHRSRFVQAMHKLQEMAGVQSASVLPVSDAHKQCV